ncbi:MAG TPA: VOC family protein [Ktedonobacteraceae bacterium]|nr:VOC family protein [Ktedonobacteraceae bacterium]
MQSKYGKAGIRLPRLHHVAVAIPAGAQDKVRAFYGGVLGLQEKTIPESLIPNGVVWFVAGDGEMELHFTPDPYLPNPKEGRHFCLEVDDLDIYRRKVEEAGLEIIEAVAIPNRPRFFTHDPFGNRIELTTIVGDYREPE